MDRIPPLPAPPKYPTLLSMALANATLEQRLAIIDQIDWRMPDVGRANVIVWGNQWGSEIIHVHPLSTLSRYVDDATFRQCLDLAHQGQSTEVLFRMGQRDDPVDLADWVRSGVLSAVLKNGTTTQLSDLIAKLAKRPRQTAHLDHPTGFERVPDPFKALALADHTTVADYKRRMKLVVRLASTQSAMQFGKAGSAWARRAAKNTERGLYTIALSRAMEKGNAPMLEAVLSIGKARLPVEALASACDKGQMEFAVQAAVALDWKIDWTARPYQELPYFTRALSAQAWRCHEILLPATRLLSDREWSLRHESVDPDPATALPAAAQLAQRTLIDLPELIKRDRDLGKPLVGMLDQLVPALMGLPADQVDDAWERLAQIKVVPKTLNSMELPWFPNTDTFTRMSCQPDNPFVRRVLRAVTELSPEQTQVFLDHQRFDLGQFWSTHSNGGLSDEQAKEPIAGVRLWWDHLPPDPSRPPLVGWMEAASVAVDPEKQQQIVRTLLEAVSAEASPAQRAAPAARKI